MEAVQDFSDVKTVTPSTVEYGSPEIRQEIDVKQIDSLTRAEIDMQIATAHRFPRSIKCFKDEALAMATLDVDTAASCFYKLPRGGKIIEGPGVRLAEIVGSSWGNMRYGARIVGEENGFVIAQGIAHDLEKNVATTIEVRRRITDRNGKKYNADMIGVTSNAACSIALRNAIFKVIPKAFVNNIYEAAKRVAIGDATTLVERRARVVDFFAKMGVMEDRLLARLGKDGVEDIDLADLETLTGLKTAIKDGDTTVDQAFPPLKEERKFSGSDKAMEKKPEAGEVTESEPSPKTKAELIEAITTIRDEVEMNDALFTAFVDDVIGQDITKAGKADLEQLYGAISDQAARNAIVTKLGKGDSPDLFTNK